MRVLIPDTTPLEVWALEFLADGAQLSRINEVRSMCCTSSKTQADVWGTS